MMMLLSRAALAAAAMALGLSAAHAAYDNRATGTLTVKLNVAASCQVGSATLDFGNQSSLSGTVTATANIPVTCTSGTSYTISLDSGLHPDADNNRYMSDGKGHNILYTLYSDAGNTIWLSPSGPITSKGSLNNIYVGASAALESTAVAGSYSDTVLITVNY